MNSPQKLFSALLALSLLCTTASAQTVTVTTSSNDIDINSSTGTIADLPGPDGKISFNEALLATDNTPGHQTIAFAIPQSEWTLQFVLPGRAVLNNFLDFRAFDSVTIDGTTQTAFTGDTNPDGNEVALYGCTLYLLADNSSLIGFDSGAFGLSCSNSEVVGNTGGMHIDVFGDNNLIDRNLAGTIKISGGNFNTVTGNTMQRVRIWSSTGNRIGGPTLADRNFITGYGTTNSEGIPSGTDIELFQTQNTLIENNYIGTTPDGMSQGNMFSNVGIKFADGNVGTVVRNNLIAGILGRGQAPHYAGTLWGHAIFFDGSGSDIEIVGNTIGLDASGAPTLPSVWGVDIGYNAFSTYTDIRFGGYGPGEGNTVAGHYFSGITVGRVIPNVRIAGNSIYGNGISAGSLVWLGIDLIPANSALGISPNDDQDADTGANGLQNFPVLDTASIEGGGTRVSGTLSSAPLQTYTLEFFASSSCNPNGFGEGELPLGTISVATDGFGQTSFSGLVAAAPSGWMVTSTATHEPLGATSEFSACLLTSESSCSTDLGFGGPGTASLSVCGEPLGTGQTAMLRVDGAKPNTRAWALVGNTYNPTPFGEAMLVPTPGTLIGLGKTDAAGALEIGPITGGGGPVSTYVQILYRDASLSGNFGFTNAVRVDFLP